MSMNNTTITTIENWENLIRKSYAHNSKLYQSFQDYATGETIYRFLCWDAEQPPFYKFLQQWLPKAPRDIEPHLSAHIKVEIEERHSQLFRDMMVTLGKRFPAEKPILNQEVLRELNYTFSPECAQEKSFAFFAGSFFATELMSAKRCEQLFYGLKRLSVPEDELEYLKIHYLADRAHMEEVKRDFLKPLCENFHQDIETGILDRLTRSENYLRWYEVNQ